MGIRRGAISSSISFLPAEQTQHPSAPGCLPATGRHPQQGHPHSGAWLRGRVAHGDTGLPVFLVEHGLQHGLPLPWEGKGAISPAAKIPLLPFWGHVDCGEGSEPHLSPAAGPCAAGGRCPSPWSCQWTGRGAGGPAARGGHAGRRSPHRPAPAPGRCPGGSWLESRAPKRGHGPSGQLLRRAGAGTACGLGRAALSCVPGVGQPRTAPSDPLGAPKAGQVSNGT